MPDLKYLYIVINYLIKKVVDICLAKFTIESHIYILIICFNSVTAVAEWLD